MAKSKIKLSDIHFLIVTLRKIYNKENDNKFQCSKFWFYQR